jgi:hypothetical protein
MTNKISMTFRVSQSRIENVSNDSKMRDINLLRLSPTLGTIEIIH